MVEIDVRGFSCPVPVVKTKKTIDENPNKRIVILVETEVSRENVSRLAQSRGYKVEVEKAQDEYRLLLIPPQNQ